MADLTVVIMTYNEEKNIGNCIKPILSIAKRIIVVDSFSTDKTQIIARELGAEVIEKECVSLSDKFMYALTTQNIATKWVMRLDADEYMTPDSANELEELCNSNENTDVNGIVVRFVNCFLGKELRHGGAYPFLKMVCFKPGKAEIEKRQQDEHIYVTEGRTVEMKHDTVHYDYKGLSKYINKHNWYSSREVLDYIESKSTSQYNEKLEPKARIKRKVKYGIYYKLPIGIRAWLYYFYRYYLKMGFLDGKEGKIYAFLQAYWYRFLVDAKIYAYEKLGELDNDV